MAKLLCAFGPLPDALVQHVNDEEAGARLKDQWREIEQAEAYDPFEQWSEENLPGFTLNNEAKRLILRMTNLDPAKRALMSDIIMDPYWH